MDGDPKSDNHAERGPQQNKRVIQLTELGILS